LTPPVSALVASHLIHHHGDDLGYTDAQVRRLARKLAPATIDDLALVMTADSRGRPPLESPETEKLIAELRAKAHALEIERAAPRPIVLGRHLLDLGRPPGPGFGPIIDTAFEAKLDGAFHDEEGGVRWLKEYLKTHGI
jgi:tRNA nucleotidyltransferase (CCA-adding enzyme)